MGNHMIQCDIALPPVWRMNWIGSERNTKVAPAQPPKQETTVQTGKVAVDMEQKLLECCGETRFMWLLVKGRKSSQRTVMSEETQSFRVIIAALAPGTMHGMQ